MNIRQTLKRLVGIFQQRKYALATDKHWLKEQKMKQARTLNEKELNALLLYINTRKHAARDRAIVLMTFWAGMRIGEVAATRIKDVLAADGTIKHEMNLTAEQTKGKYGRTVVLADKLRKELMNYLLTRFDKKELVGFAPIKQYQHYSLG